MDKNTAVFAISENNLPEGIYEVTSTDLEIPANTTTLYNISAPEVKNVNVKTGAKDLVLTLNEKVKATAEGSIAVEVRKDDTLIDVGTPVLSEDGLTITIPSKDGSVFADAKYDVKLSGVSDMTGLPIADKNTATITKNTVADKIEITSTGVAPAANQTIAYKLTDNYGVEYTDATALASGKITSATAIVKATGLPVEVAISGDKTAAFDAAGLAKDAEIEVNITYTAGDVTKTATTTLKVGETAASASIKNITLSNALGETDPEGNGFILGKLTKFDLTANLLDQYGSAFTPGTDNVVTWSISDKNVLTFGDDIATGDIDESTKAVWNSTNRTKTFEVKGQGTTVITAYLANGAKVERKITVTLAGLKSIVATNVTGAVNFEDKEVTTGFTFTDTNDQTNTLKPLANDIKFDFKSATNNATATDILVSNIANEDGTFKGIKINAKKSAVYTITMTYAGKTFDFTVTSAADSQVVKIADIADMIAKKNAAETKFDVTAMNKHDEKLDVQKQNLLLTWYNEAGQVVADVSGDFTIKYYKADGTEATQNTDVVSKVGISFKGTEAKNYTLKAEVTNTIAVDTAKVSCSVPELKTIQITKGITADNKLIVGDTEASSQYVDIALKDMDGDIMLTTTGSSIKVKDTNGADAATGFVNYAYKHVAEDGKVTYDAVATGAVGLALKFNPSVANLASGTYSVWIEKGTAGQAGYIKSNVVNVVTREARILSTVTSESKSIVSTLGAVNEIVIIPTDQYGDVISIANPAQDITVTTGSGIVSLIDVQPKQVDEKLAGYTLSLRGNTKGTDIVTVNAKFSETITKTLTLNAEVKAAGDIVSLNFSNDADKDGIVDTKLHDTVMGETDTYNTVKLNLSGLDANGNVITVNPSDFVWDTSALPGSIVFNADTATFSVNKTVIEAGKVVNGTIKAYQAGKLVGTITITLTDAEPTLESLNFADADKVKEIAAGDANVLDLSTIALVAKDNFGGDANPAITANSITNWKSADSSKAIYVPLVEGTPGKIKVVDGATVGDTVIFTGSYGGQVVTFTVKVKAAQ